MGSLRTNVNCFDGSRRELIDYKGEVGGIYAIKGNCWEFVKNLINNSIRSVMGLSHLQVGEH